MSEYLFQEAHTKGYLWWKRPYYKYFKYREGYMVQISIFDYETIKSIERGK